MTPSKITRKELLKSSDEFLTFTARTIQFIKDHQQIFSYAGIGFLAAIVIYLALMAYFTYTNKKGQELYNQAYNTFIKYESAPADQKEGDLKKTEELLQNVQAQQKFSKASRLVPPQLAYLKFQQKKYDEALALYGEFQHKLSADSPYYILAGIAMAACHEEKGENQKAVSELEKLLASPTENFKEQVLINLARGYRLSNQEDKSKQVLQQFIDKYPESPFLPQVKSQLAQ